MRNLRDSILKKLKGGEINPVEEPEFNTNFWSQDCFDLFNYLVANYEKDGNVKYINIYYFLKEIAKEHSDKYRFKMRIDKDYKPLIKDRFKIALTKFAKAQFAYKDEELPILKDLEKNLRKLPN